MRDSSEEELDISANKTPGPMHAYQTDLGFKLPNEATIEATLRVSLAETKLVDLALVA